MPEIIASSNCVILPPIIEWALNYSKLGLEVFPYKHENGGSYWSAAHSDGAKWGKTRDPARIDRFPPQAGVAAATGKVSGTWVLDLDRKDGKDGVAELERLAALHPDEPIPATWLARTPSGGIHHHFRWVDGIANSASVIAPGIDVRGEGGMTPLPPTAKPHGAYEWVEGRSPWDMPLAAAPAWLLELARKPQKPPQGTVSTLSAGAATGAGISDQRLRKWGLAALQAETWNVAHAHPGERNATLNAAACAIGHKIPHAIAEDEAVQALLEACHRNRGMIDDDGEQAALATIRSGLEFGMKDPQWPEDRQPLRVQRQVQRRAFSFQLAGEIEPTDPVFLVDGLIEVGTLVQLFGDPGAGKSFLAIDWAYCVATGCDFHGREVKQGTVAYIAGEGRQGFARRREAWGQHHDIDTKTAPVYLSRGPASLLDATAEVQEAIAALPEPPALIVIDTLARNFGDGDPDKTKDMSNFISALDGIKDEYPDCVVLVVHHSGHSEKHRARNSSAMYGALDTEFRLEKKNDHRILTSTKEKENEPPEPLHFTIQPTGRSAVLVESAAQEGDVLTPQQRQALAAFVEAAVSEQHPGDETLISTEVWRQKFYEALGDKSASGKKSAFLRVRESLAEKGYITERGDGYIPDHIRQTQIRMRNMGFGA